MYKIVDDLNVQTLISDLKQYNNQEIDNQMSFFESEKYYYYNDTDQDAMAEFNDIMAKLELLKKENNRIFSNKEKVLHKIYLLIKEYDEGTSYMYTYKLYKNNKLISSL